jgi:hypothetical protein
MLTSVREEVYVKSKHVTGRPFKFVRDCSSPRNRHAQAVIAA